LFDEFAKQLNAVEIVKRFRLEIENRLNGVEDVTPLKSVGLSEYMLVNGAGQLPDAAIATPAIWQACKLVMEVGSGLGLRLQIGVCAESEVVMGLMSTDNLSFDIFGRALKTSRALAKKASIGSVSVDKVSFSRFSETVGCPGRPVTFKIGSTSYSAVEIQVASPVVAERH
jgi:hypothetical protein